MNNLTEQMEQDQTEVIKSTTNIKTLSDQVLKLRAMEDQLKIMEDALKTKKKEIDRVSGEVIPTMLSEMGLSQLKLADGSSVDVKPFYSATISAQKPIAGFVQMALEILSRMIYLSPLVATKMTRQQNMLILRRVMGFSQHKS
jgi:hypothetical protein